MIALRDSWAKALLETAGADQRILLLDADLATSTKADLFARELPDRFLQMGIAEQNMVGVAVGLADHGYIPWLSSFAVFFSHRALDPIRMLVAQSDANVKIAAAYAGVLTGGAGKTHQDVQDLAILRAMPGMTVLCPADDRECRAMVEWANAYHGPVYLRLARDPEPEVFGESYRFRLGQVVSLADGPDVAIVSTGIQTARVLESVKLLRATGIEAAVVHLPTVKPLDVDQLRRALTGQHTVAVVEEHSVIGGLGALVAECLTSAPGAPQLVRIGIRDRWGESASNPDLLERFGLSPQRVAETIRDVLVGQSAQSSAVVA